MFFSSINIKNKEIIAMMRIKERRKKLNGSSFSLHKFLNIRSFKKRKSVRSISV